MEGIFIRHLHMLWIIFKTYIVLQTEHRRENKYRAAFDYYQPKNFARVNYIQMIFSRIYLIMYMHQYNFRMTWHACWWAFYRRRAYLMEEKLEALDPDWKQKVSLLDEEEQPE